MKKLSIYSITFVAINKRRSFPSVINKVLFFCFSFFFYTNALFSNVIITAPSLSINTCLFPSAYSSLNDIVITEGANGDFLTGSAVNTNYTFTITAPANFEFRAGSGSTATSTLGDITSISIAVTANTITVTYSSSQANRTNGNDIIRISGIQVRAITGIATQVATKTAETLAITGFPNGTAVANLQSQVIADNCLAFDNVDDYAEIPAVAAFDITAAVTLEAWIYPTSWKANSWEGSIINKEDGAAGAYMIRCGNSGQLSFNIGIGGVWYELQSAVGALSLNTWQHVAGVYDGSNMYLYINGAQVATIAQTGAMGINTRPVRIGAWAQSTDRLFPGKIDEVRIWNTGLNACTIFTWYNQPVSASHPNWANLAGYYEMNNTTAGILTATIGTNGTLFNGPTYGLSSNPAFNICGGGSGIGLTAAQPNTSSVSPGATNQEILKIEVEATGVINATELKLRTNGCTNVADIANAKLWYTGSSPVFTTGTQFGATILVPPVAGIDMTFSGTQALTCGKNYFWLSYDIQAGATLGDVVDGQLQSATVNAVVRTPTISAPVGSRPIANVCTHTIRLTDTFGDGWNGGTITVTVNGTPVLTNITLAAGAGPQDFTFSASTGDVINVTRTADGSFPTEMRIQVFDGTSGVIIATKEPANTPGDNALGCCSATVPGCATIIFPANGATGINPCSLDLSWTAPVSGGCNGASSYDIYFGTNAAPPFLVNQTGTIYSLPNALSDNTIYYWKIVPRNGAGAAVGCGTYSFTTGTTSNSIYCFYGNSTNYPAGGSNCGQLTPNIGGQNGCAWNRGQISFAAAFDYSVNMYFGAAAGGADGCAFVFQNSPQGISQCGTTGGQLGAGGISNAVVIEFDTYDNDWPAHVYDMSVDHTAIEIDGNMQGPGAPLCGPVQADPLDGLLADGLIHSLRITWNPATQQICVYVDGSQRLCCNYDFINNVFGGNPNVYWGFTASTGALANQQYFCPVNIPLPVSLLDFSASCNNGSVKLDWYTASETNNDYFTIERSENAVDFTQIARIDGAGNSNELLHYVWTNDSQDGTYYYRLVQTDFDGAINILPIVTVNCTEEVNDINIAMAAETNNYLILEFEIPEAGFYTLEVSDILGRSITSLTTEFNRGVNRSDLYTPNIRSGIYIITIRNSDSYASRKFISQ
jgi:hypothetical protein